MFIQNIDEDNINIEQMQEILSDSDTQSILDTVKESPKSINQICMECKIPTSTAYRKVQKLTEYRILHRMGKINDDGKRENLYKPNTNLAKIFLT